MQNFDNSATIKIRSRIPHLGRLSIYTIFCFTFL
nr:MAG TPA: hypothetical protein [Caudoviricetes sp.]